MATAEKKTEKTEITAQDLEKFIRTEIERSMGAALNQLTTQLQQKQTQLDHLADAYVKAVGQCNDAVKNATNPHLRNTYADLGSVLAAVREAFLSNGLWLVQCPGPMNIKEGRPYIAMGGVLLHKSGQSLTFQMELPAFTLSKSGDVVLNPQTSGSAISYARRYMWAAVAGITQVDDDGDEASYIDSSKGPTPPAKSTQQRNTVPAPAQDAAPQSTNDAAEMLKKIAGAKTMDELKTLRVPAQALKSKPVSDAYMAKRDTFQPS